MRSKEEILKDFLKEFPIAEGKAKRPHIILLDGYTGMGKTTVAKCIQKYHPAVILSNDEVRYFLNDYQDRSDLKNFLQRYRLEKLLEHHNHCIYDSCFCNHYEEKLKYFNKLGYPYYIIRIECPEEIVEERLKHRTVTKDNYSIATFDDYLWMKENVQRAPMELIAFTIDTSQEIEPQVLKFVHEVLEKGDFYERS